VVIESDVPLWTACGPRQPHLPLSLGDNKEAANSRRNRVQLLPRRLRTDVRRFANCSSTMKLESREPMHLYQFARGDSLANGAHLAEQYSVRRVCAEFWSQPRRNRPDDSSVESSATEPRNQRANDLRQGSPGR
jgi:hypothetical protein